MLEEPKALDSRAPGKLKQYVASMSSVKQHQVRLPATLYSHFPSASKLLLFAELESHSTYT